MAMSAKASDDIAWLPATAQLAVLAAKKVSSAELVELYLSRIDTYNASLNAIVTVDPDAARRVAKRSDAARARGDELGPLHGLPITVGPGHANALDPPRRVAGFAGRRRVNGGLLSGGNSDLLADVADVVAQYSPPIVELIGDAHDRQAAPCDSF